MCAVRSAREATSAVSGDAISYARTMRSSPCANTAYGSRIASGFGPATITLRMRGAGVSNSGGATSVAIAMGRSRARSSAPSRYVGVMPVAHSTADSRSLCVVSRGVRTGNWPALSGMNSIHASHFSFRGRPHARAAHTLASLPLTFSYSTRTSVMTDPPRTPPESPAGSQGITRCCDGSVGHDLDGRARLDAELRQRAIEVLFPVLLARDAEAHPTLRETLAAGLPDLADDVAKR